MPLKRIALLAALAVASCAPGGVKLWLHEVDTAYRFGEFTYATAGGRDLRVVAAGNPFGGDPAAFGRAVTDAMQGRNRGKPVDFSTVLGPDTREVYRVVLLFDPPVSFNGVRLCRMDPADLPTRADAADITLHGAFCRGRKSLTEIKGRIAGASGSTDPVFRELVGRITFNLFPPRTRIDAAGDRCGLPMVCP